MDRRETLKSLLLGTMAGGLMMKGCAPAEEVADQSDSEGYGRTEQEKIRDEELQTEIFFSEHELATIAILCDIILPADDISGSATEADVPAFIEFIAKDLPQHQMPLRGGLMWLDHEANSRFGSTFKHLDSGQQMQLVDLIAYPDNHRPEHKPGVTFFSRLRNLTLTGYYTTRMGMDALGYQGNIPNVWDGVPEEVLAKHGLQYDEEWLSKCIDQDIRNEIARWDQNGDLIE